MSDDAPRFQSIPVPADGGPVRVTWTPDADAEAYIYCVLQTPIAPEGAAALLAGGLDLMMARYVLPPGESAVAEAPASLGGHRLVLTRTWAQRLRPVSGLVVLAGAADATPLSRFGAPVDSWTAGQRVGDGPLPEPVAAPRTGSARPARAFVEEPGAVTGKRPPSFVERPMTIREGVARAAAKRAAGQGVPRTPLEAYQTKVEPRQEQRRGLMPPTATAPAGAGPAEVAASAAPDEDVALRWVLIGSETLLSDPGKARPVLRMLRGYLRVGFAGVPNRAGLQRRADLIDVPLDGIFAMLPDHPNLASAVGCPAAAIAYVVTADAECPVGMRRVDATPETLAEVASRLIADERPEDS